MLRIENQQYYGWKISEPQVHCLEKTLVLYSNDSIFLDINYFGPFF